MRALVTGSTGFAGSALARSLEADGHAVTGFDLALGDDIRDYEQVRTAVAQAEPDLVFHLAAVAHPAEAKGDPRRALEVNVTGTMNVLEAVRVTGSDAKVLITGSSDEYGNEGRAPGEVLTEDSACRPTSPYGASKLAATSLGMAYHSTFGLPVVACRAFMHAGPGKRGTTAVGAFARRVVAVERGEADRVVHGNLDPLYDITDVRDVVRAYRKAIYCPPGIYNVCRGDLTALWQVMHTLIGLSTAESVPLEEDPRFGGKPNALYPQGSAAKLRAASGWEPLVPLKDTLRELLNHWRSQ
ncbi:MAG TPA: NAD-dependent epimerase/dehydratase family protein [Streptosporangiaceae bacterium]|nr:NAD-dependent epimerase/dehydratase family protein [Streptosporangiaceae bacterium]